MGEKSKNIVLLLSAMKREGIMIDGIFFFIFYFLIENLTNLGEKLRTVPMLSCDTDPKLEPKLCSFDRSLGRDVEPSQSVD